MNNKVLVVLPLLLAVAVAQNAFSFDSFPLTLTPGTPAITSFTEYVGDQYKLWLPWNVSSIQLSVQRDDESCSSQAVYVRLYGKFVTYPCSSSAYSGLDEFCNGYGKIQLLSATSSSVYTVDLDAYYAYYLTYTYSGTSGSDLLRGAYLYLAMESDVFNTNCTATLTANFTYCPTGTIATEGLSSDALCSAYTNVTGSTYNTVQSVTGPFQHLYMVHVPQNSSGIEVTIVNNDNEYIYIYGRISIGGESNNYYDYSGSYANQSIWFPNPPAGDFIITIENTATVNQTYDMTISVESCAAGWGPDVDGLCAYSVNTTTLAALASDSTVNIPAATVSGYCNWTFHAVYIPPLTYGYFNLSVSRPAASAYAYLRRNAFPTESLYDDYIFSDDTWNFTPEDMYTDQATWYYIGFCNEDATTSITYTLSGTYAAAGPSPSASPVSVASASASPDSDSGSDSGASAIIFSVFITLAALLLAF